MDKQTVSLKADGAVSIADFQIVIEALLDVLSALTAESTSNPKTVTWVIDDLKAGSATIVGRGIGETFLATQAVDQVVSRYGRLAQKAHQGHIEEFSEPIQMAMRRMAGLINGQITSISLGEAQGKWTINPLIRASDVERIEDHRGTLNQYARTSIRGQVVTLDDKRTLYFTLREAHTGRHIRCYPTEKYKHKLSDYWANNSWVLVEGTYSRYSGSPVLYDITDIVPFEDSSAGSWRDAIGCAPRQPGAEDISSAEAVRMVRDGE